MLVAKKLTQSGWSKFLLPAVALALLTGSASAQNPLMPSVSLGKEQKRQLTPEEQERQKQIVAIGTPIGAMLGWSKPLLRWFQSLTKTKVEQKGISLNFVPNDLRCRWSKGRFNNEPTTTVHGRWHVTNSSKGNVVILKARLDKHASRFAQLSTRHPDKKDYFSSDYPILSHRMSEVWVNLEFYPPIGQGHEPIVSDVIFR